MGIFDKSGQKGIMKKVEEQRKTFNYELDGISFNIVLRVDIKKELVAMKEILKVASVDVEKELLILDTKK